MTADAALTADDVFVAAPARIDAVRRTIERCLHSAPFPTENDPTRPARLGTRTLVHVNGHGFGDDTVVFPTGYPVRLATDFPVWVALRGHDCAFDQQAAARRAYTVLVNHGWAAVLVRDLQHVLCSTRCDALGAAYDLPATPAGGERS